MASADDLAGLYLLRKHGPDGAPPNELVDPDPFADPFAETGAVEREQERRRQQQLQQLQQTTGAVERQVGNQAADPLNQAAQTGVSIPSMTPEGAPNLPTGIPQATLINRAGQIVPPGFRGTEGRGYAPTPEETTNLGVTTEPGLVSLVAGKMADTDPYKPTAMMLARSMDFIGSVLNVPFDVGATGLTRSRSNQEYYDALAQAGVPPEKIKELQGTLHTAYNVLLQLALPAEVGGAGLVELKTETVQAVLQNVKSLAASLAERAKAAGQAVPDVLQAARETMPALRPGGVASEAGIVKLGPGATELPPILAEVKIKKAGEKDVPAPGPNPEVRDVANSYMEENRIPIPARPNRYVEVKESNAKKIADAFDEMKHDPTNPQVVESYSALNRESVAQWDHAVSRGMTFEPWKGEGQPYPDSAAMRHDVEQNHHLYFFQGGEFSTDHPMMTPSGRTATLADGTTVDLSYNDVFRAIHDYFGHAQYGYGFGARGEENAWLTHAAMFSDTAIPAMTSETRGQNSYVNFGRHLRDESGRVAKLGEPGFVPLPERPFAEQKVGLLPEHFYANDFERRDAVLLPTTTRAMEGFAKGEHRPGWWVGAPEELTKSFGRDDNLMAANIAILSQQKGPTPNTQLALQAYKLWKTEGVDGLKKMGVMGTQRRELIRAAQLFEQNPLADLEQSMSLTSLKRRDMYAVMRGATDRPVIDRHIGPMLFGDAFRADDPDQYRRGSDIIKKLAAKAGVEPIRYQDAMWIAERERKGLMKDNEPYIEIFRRVLDNSPHDIRDLVQPEYARTFVTKGEAARTGEAGFGDLQIVNFMAQTALGAASGAYSGDTTEEKVRNALIGAGIGATTGLLTPKLVRAISRIVEGLPAAAPKAAEITSALMGDIAKEQHLRVVPATAEEQARYIAAGQAVPADPGRIVQLNWASIRDPNGLDAMVRDLITSRPPPEKPMTMEEIHTLSRELGLTTAQTEAMAQNGALAARMYAWKDLTQAAHAHLGTLTTDLKALTRDHPNFPAAEDAFRRQFGVTAALAGGLAKESSELGRAMNVLRQIPKEMDLASLATLAQKDISYLPTETLVGMVESLPAREEKLSFFQQVGKHSMEMGHLGLHTLNWAFMNSRLATIDGGVANMLTNLAMMAESPLTRMIAAGGGSVESMIRQAMGMTGRLDRVYWGESFAQMIGTTVGVGESLANWAEPLRDITLRGGESKFGGIAKDVPRFKPTGESFPQTMDAVNKVLRPITKPLLGMDMPAEAAIRLATTLVELPQRTLLMAPDEIAKFGNYRGEVWAQAYNMVMQEFGGKWFAPLRDIPHPLMRVATGVTDVTGAMETRAVTSRERFLEIIRHPEDVVKQVSTTKTESVSDIARDAANIRTFNEPLTGKLAKLGDVLDGPIIRMTTVPYFKVPMNIGKAGLERFPGLGWLVQRARDDIYAGGARRDMVAARWALAGGIMAIGAWRGLDGTLIGGGSLNPNVKELERMAGQQPYSLVLNDNVVINLNRFDVFGQMMMLAADYVQLRPHMRDDEAEAIASAIVLVVSRNFFSKTWMEGMANVAKLLMSRDPQHLEKNPIIRNLARSVVPSGVAQIEKYADPAMREVESLFDEVRARVPGISASLEPQLNWLTGEIKLAPQGWSPSWLPGFVSVISPFKVTHLNHDPVVKELLHLQFSLGAPPDFLYGTNPESLAAPKPSQGVPLTAKQHHDYTKLAATTEIRGKNQYEALWDWIHPDGQYHAQYMRLTDGPQGTRADQLHGIVMMYRAEAQRKLQQMPENADLVHRMIQKEDDMIGAKTGQHLTPQQHEQWFQGLTR